MAGSDREKPDPALARLAHQIDMARTDIDAFVEFVFKDESSQVPVRQAPFHRKWQKAITENDRLVLFAPVEHGKSSQAVARALWEIGRNPLIHIAYISSTARQAQKFLASVRQYIEHSPEYRAVFPEVGPTTRIDEPWTQSAIVVDRPYGVRDPTLQALGAYGPIQGSRLDLVIIDDVLDFENTLTQEQRQKTIYWFDSTVTGRMLPRGKIVVIGTPWHPNDLQHELSSRPGWTTIRDSAIVDGKPLWPSRWTMERLEQRKEEYGSREFSRQMLCIARDDATSRFREEWIAKCKNRGRGKILVTQYAGPFPTVCGIDLAVQQGEENDLTAMFTIALHPDGSRELLNIRSGKWTSPDIVRAIVDVYAKFRCQLMLVENNAAQDYIRQWLTSSTSIPIRGYTTGKAKAHPVLGIESLAVEMENGKWILPCDEAGRCHPEVQAFIDEAVFYSPSTHTGDRLMAAFLAREASRQVGSVGIVADVGDFLAR